MPISDLRQTELLTYWVDKRSFNEGAAKLVDEKIRARDKRVSAVYVTLQFEGADSHANVLVVDKLYKTVERFEPHGESVDFYDQSVVEGDIADLMKTVPALQGFQYVGIGKGECPAIGPQTVAEMSDLARQKDKECDGSWGFCALHSLLIAHLRIAFPQFAVTEIANLMLNRFSPNELFLLAARYWSMVTQVTERNTEIYDSGYGGLQRLLQRFPEELATFIEPFRIGGDVFNSIMPVAVQTVTPRLWAQLGFARPDISSPLNGQIVALRGEGAQESPQNYKWARATQKKAKEGILRKIGRKIAARKAQVLFEVRLGEQETFELSEFEFLARAWKLDATCAAIGGFGGLEFTDLRAAK